MISRLRQTTKTISVSNEKELSEKINALNAEASMPMNIWHTSSEATDTKTWYKVNYWEHY